MLHCTVQSLIQSLIFSRGKFLLCLFYVPFDINSTSNCYQKSDAANLYNRVYSYSQFTILYFLFHHSLFVFVTRRVTANSLYFE